MGHRIQTPVVHDLYFVAACWATAVEEMLALERGARSLVEYFLFDLCGAERHSACPDVFIPHPVRLCFCAWRCAPRHERSCGVEFCLTKPWSSLLGDAGSCSWYLVEFLYVIVQYGTKERE